MELIVTVSGEKARLALERFRLNLGQRQQLMKVIGAGQLQSVYKTFDDEGPGWPPLSPNSLSWNRKYDDGHKLLVKSGLGRSSIGVTSTNDSATLSTNLWYMALQHRGWSGTQEVAPYSYSRHVASRDQFGRVTITNKNQKQQTVRRKLVSGIAIVEVSGFSRKLTIPPRPFMVFRPEDPGRIATEVRIFVEKSAADAGLGVS